MDNLHEHFVDLMMAGRVEELEAWVHAIQRLRDVAVATREARQEIEQLDSKPEPEPEPEEAMPARESGIFRAVANRPEHYDRSETRDPRLPARLWYARDTNRRIWGFARKDARDDWVEHHEGWRAAERLYDPELDHELRHLGFVHFARLEDGQVLSRARL